MSTLAIVLIAVGCLLTIVAVVAAAVAWHIEGGLLAMRETPTLSVADIAERHRWATYGSAAFGQAVEVVGTIECDAPIATPYSETLCVAYDYAVTEESEQLIGRPGSPHAREFEFGGRDSDQRHVPRFYVHDATGRVAIDPQGARFDMVETVARFEAYTGPGRREREIWREEQALPLGNRVYVLGYLGDDGGAPLIGRHPTEPARRFVISHRDERTLSARVRVQAYALYVGALLGAAGALVAFATAITR